MNVMWFKTWLWCDDMMMLEWFRILLYFSVSKETNNEKFLVLKLLVLKLNRAGNPNSGFHFHSPLEKLWCIVCWTSKRSHLQPWYSVWTLHPCWHPNSTCILECEHHLTQQAMLSDQTHVSRHLCAFFMLEYQQIARNWPKHCKPGCGMFNVHNIWLWTFRFLCAVPPNVWLGKLFQNWCSAIL